MNRLDGKVALISGAARGIGGETARLIARAGAKLVVGDVLDDRGRETVATITADGAQAEYVHLDVTKEEDWTAAVDLAVSRFGKLESWSITPVSSSAKGSKRSAWTNGTSWSR